MLKINVSSFSAVTIGFERSRYTISEPASGTATIEVCMILTVGSLGRAVIVEPQWIPDSAQGKQTAVHITVSNAITLSIVKISFDLCE